MYRISSAVHENVRYAFGRRLHKEAAAATYSKHCMCLHVLTYSGKDYVMPKKEPNDPQNTQPPELTGTS